MCPAKQVKSKAEDSDKVERKNPPNCSTTFFSL